MTHTVARRNGALVAALLLLAIASPLAAQVPSPEAFFGFRMGADRQLADWASIERYFQAVDAASDRVQLVDAGPTTEGRRIIAALISAPENLRNLEALQIDNRLLADPRRLAGEREAAAILGGARPVVAIGSSIHASEVGATQSANELLYELAASSDLRTLGILENVIVVLFPSLNPDGHTMVVDWYRKTLGTPFEGAPMPWMYHRYVGHDINRDMFMLNMQESRTLAHFFSRVWHPQVFLAMHQMGANGPRYFVPPNYDPIDDNQDPLIWREAALLGSAMAMELEREGKSGVISNAMYDYYWPGYEDSAPLGRNTVCLLTEAASVRLATPVDVAAKDLRGTTRGLPEYRAQINFPSPWPGGAWHLRDIVDYNLTAVRGLLAAAARYKDELLSNFLAMGRRSIARGSTTGPHAFVIPPEQHDQIAAQRLVSLLAEGGVDVFQAQEPFKAGDAFYPEGTVIVPMAQPFRAYAKSLLEVQHYPVRRLAPEAPPERPYDVAGWTLPFQMGVRVDEIGTAFEAPVMARLDRGAVKPSYVLGHTRPNYFLVDARGNAGILAANRLLKAGVALEWTVSPASLDGFTWPAGSFVIRQVERARPAVYGLARDLGLRIFGMRGRPPTSVPIASARTGLYRPWLDAIDEGWTRWLLEQHEFPFQTLRDAEVRAGNLRAAYDVIILPSVPSRRLVEGNRAGTLPDEYVGGLGEAGVAALKAFVQAGGTLICLDASAALAIDALGLPVRNVVQGLSPKEFFCPGSVLRLDLDPTQALASGMMPETAAFFSMSSAYEVTAPAGVRVVARYGEKDLLMSGWLEGQSVIAGKAAVLEVRAGQGRAVLIGFRAQHRGQSHATFRLLFNAVLTSGGTR
ncbi:MAG: M14 family metallopeptidase [Acidobacteriota bacterium]